MSMFDGFIDFLTSVSSKDEGNSFGPVLVSATSLLINVMDSDGQRLPEEKTALRKLLKMRYKVEDEDMQHLFAAGDEHDKNSVDFYGATSILQKELSRDEKKSFVEMMWLIVYADGERHEVEDHVLNRIADLIGIERAAQIALRQRVEARLASR